MFRNYLKVAIRNLARQKLYSLINMIGLALGLASVIFLILFAQDELSYDKNYAEASQNLQGPGTSGTSRRRTFNRAQVPGPTGSPWLKISRRFYIKLHL